MNRTAWILSFIVLLSVVRFAYAETPERDIVRIESSTPLAEMERVPGLLTGRRVIDVLRNSLTLVSEDALEPVRLDLQEISRDLKRLMAGEDLDSPLPASYRTAGELWLPVHAEQLKVRLDAPDLLPRPQQGGPGGQVGNLSARAQRIAWLPVARTAWLLEQTRPLLGVDGVGRVRARHQLASILRSVRTRLVLENRPLIIAYYRVEAALAAAPRWDESIRSRLRRAAEALDGQPNAVDLADRIQAQADRLTQDVQGLRDLALTLHRRIELAAETGHGAASKLVAP